MLPFLCMLLVMGGGNDDIKLPAPSHDGNMSLENALHARRSTRSFSDTDLTLEELSQILWAAQGISDTLYSRPLRTAPSAGALYPLEIYILSREGTYHYITDSHSLTKIRAGDARAKLSQVALSQSAIADAPVSIVITAIYERTMVKYGERGTRYVHLEVGHAAQNILLQAVSLGLASVPIGAFHDDKVISVVGCSDEEVPLYIIPIGSPE